MRNFLYTLFALLFSFGTAFAQEKVPMAEGLRSEENIYVVVLVMLVIFSVVAIYIFTIDRKVSKKEKDK